MKSKAKIPVVFVGGLIGLLALGLIAVFAISAIQSGKTYAIQAEKLDVSVPSDATSIERGRYLVRVVGACEDCHGPDLGGKRVDIDAAYAYFKSLPAKADETP